ncbi:oligosaccharide flippase family protein [Sphingomonas sp.]|uniref:lipopolysaccharide biosynthesis protein n=1 Tax=Sphingomonas sp. TaxID=28214 RepID=UPI0025F77AAB|nr:oligosaccharide flippase family protein [Sphingomonas sp.]
MPSANGAAGFKRIFGNLGLLLGGKAGAGALSLLYLIIVARALGAHDYGVLVLLHAYVTLVGGIVAFSGWHGIVRFGSLALEQSDHQRFLKVARFLTLVEIGFGAAAIITVIALVPIVGPHLDWPPEAMKFAALYSLATLANVRSTPLGILQLRGRFDLIAAHHLVSPVVRLAGCILVWLLGGGLIGFLAVWLASALAEWVSMWVFGLWQLHRMELGVPITGPVRGTIEENEGLLPFIATTNVDITLRELAPRLVPLSVGWMLGPAAAGLFALAQRASVVLEQPALLLGQASYAVLAKLVVERDFAQFRHTVWRSAGSALLLSVPVIVLLAFFSSTILDLLGGNSFRSGAELLILLAVARSIAIAAPPIASALIAMGQPSQSIGVNLAANLLLFPVLLLLLSWYGLDGSGYHAVIQAACSTGLLALLFRRSARGLA